jgi:hypothetical protein
MGGWPEIGDYGPSSPPRAPARDCSAGYSGKIQAPWAGCPKIGGPPQKTARILPDGHPLSHLPCIPLFQRVCVTPRTSPVTPPWRPSRRRDRAVPVMALFSFVALASALVLAFSFG